MRKLLGFLGKARAAESAARSAHVVGSMAGASGATIMGSLAAAGFGSAALGPVALGANLGFGTAELLNNTVFSETGRLTLAERAARQAARTATKVGAASGSVAVGGGLVSAGVLGGSGSAITSGIAGIGALAGGGMALGVLILAAAPVACAAGAGFAVRVWRRRSER